MSMKQYKAIVTQNIQCVPGLNLLKLQTRELLPHIAPGQFLMLNVHDFPNIVLKRPMAFMDASANELTILYNVVGRATKLLQSYQTGKELSFLAPIGNVFVKPKPEERTLIVAGGIGIAPFYLWYKSYGHKNTLMLMGLKSDDQLPIVDDFKRLGLKTFCSVDRGQKGDVQGTVLDLLNQKVNIKDFDLILTCGPNIMMEKIYDLAKAHQIRLQASLEAKMACAMGVCLSCVSDFKGFKQNEKKLLCVDGPVFSF